MPHNFKTEKILAWIGNILSILSTLIGILFVVVVTKMPDFKKEYVTEYLKYPDATLNDANSTYNLVVMYIQGMVILSAIFLILALVGTLMLKKSKASGIILIITGILKLILTFGIGIITSILWIIAGIKRVMYKEKNHAQDDDNELPLVENLKDPYEYR